MISVRKSPNIRSTTGLRPVIAAPTPMPVKPGSEMGVSITRSVPNSSTRPARTLNGVPASATSSPRISTRSSRRISSASASFTAFEKLITRVRVATSGVDMLVDLALVGVGRVQGEGHGGLGLVADLALDRLELGRVDVELADEPRGEQRDRIALRAPRLLFVLAAVVGAVDVADVVAVVAVRVAQQERRSLAAAGAAHELGGGGTDGAEVLAVDVLDVDAERARAVEDRAGGDLVVVGVLVVHVVLAHVHDRQLPELRHVHHFVQQALAQRALAEEADGDVAVAAPLGAQGGAGGDAGAAADDGVGAQVAVLLVGDVHAAALAAAVAVAAAEQLGEHPVQRGALRDAVTVAAVGAGDRVLAAQRLAHADRDRLLAGVHVRQAGHARGEVEVVGVLLEDADALHLPVGAEPIVAVRRLGRGGVVSCGRFAHASSSFVCALRARFCLRTAASLSRLTWARWSSIACFAAAASRSRTAARMVRWCAWPRSGPPSISKISPRSSCSRSTIESRIRGMRRFRLARASCWWKRLSARMNASASPIARLISWMDASMCSRSSASARRAARAATPGSSSSRSSTSSRRRSSSCPIRISVWIEFLSAPAVPSTTNVP